MRVRVRSARATAEPHCWLGEPAVETICEGRRRGGEEEGREEGVRGRPPSGAAAGVGVTRPGGGRRRVRVSVRVRVRIMVRVRARVMAWRRVAARGAMLVGRCSRGRPTAVVIVTTAAALRVAGSTAVGVL